MKIENVVKKFSDKVQYLCPKCRESANIKDKSLVCEAGHRYDFSKKGYLHLINNYKGTKYDSALFEARKIVFSNNFYKPVFSQIANSIKKYAQGIVLDLGCGEGYYINNLKTVFPEKYFYGIDNSKDAIELAVKEDKANPYMIANLSELPFSQSSVSCILNILTPANYEEFFRVLGEDGYLIKVIPNADYLKEIRDITGAKNYTNSDTVSLIEKSCAIVERINVKESYALNEHLAEQFLKMTPLTFSKDITQNDIKNLKSITIDLEILICKKKV